MNENKKQFSFTRAALSTGGRAKNQIPISKAMLSLGAALLLSGCEKQQTSATDASNGSSELAAEKARLESDLVIAKRKEQIVDDLQAKFRSLKDSFSPQDSRSAVFHNSISVTLAGIDHESEARHAYAVAIPLDTLMQADIPCAPGEDLKTYQSLPYWEKVSSALNAYGYLESGRLRTPNNVLMMGKDFFANSLPSDAYLITDDNFRGFFVRQNGDLIIPGLKFYSEIASGRINPASFPTTPYYFKSQINGSGHMINDGNPRGAIEMIDNFLKSPMAPASVICVAHCNKGVAYELLRDYDQALACYNQAIQYDPNFSQSYFRRGTILYRAGHNSEAKQDVEKAISLEPDEKKKNDINSVLMLISQ